MTGLKSIRIREGRFIRSGIGLTSLLLLFGVVFSQCASDQRTWTSLRLENLGLELRFRLPEGCPNHFAFNYQSDYSCGDREVDLFSSRDSQAEVPDTIYPFGGKYPQWEHASGGVALVVKEPLSADCFDFGRPSFHEHVKQVEGLPSFSYTRNHEEIKMITWDRLDAISVVKSYDDSTKVTHEWSAYVLAEGAYFELVMRSTGSSPANVSLVGRELLESLRIQRIRP